MRVAWCSINQNDRLTMQQQPVTGYYVPKKSRSRTKQRQAAEEILLLCATAAVSAEAKVRLSRILNQAVDWKHLLRLAEFHRIFPLIAHNLISEGFSKKIPQSCLDQLRNGYNTVIYTNIILSRDLANVLAAFNSHGIESIPLKGTILAEILYGNPGLRTIVDIDVLVRSNDIPMARTIVTEMGYKQIEQEDRRQHRFHGAPYLKNGQFPVFLELHWALDDDRLVSIPEKEIWSRARTLEISGLSTLTLSPEDNLLFIANGLSKNEPHFLKILADIAELLKKYQENLDWDYILESAKTWQIDTAVYLALRRVEYLLMAPVPDRVIEEIKPRLWRLWLFDILISGKPFVSPIQWTKLRLETNAVLRSLTVKGFRRMYLVFAMYRGIGKRGVWIRTAFWIVIVLTSGLLRSFAKALMMFLDKVIEKYT